MKCPWSSSFLVVINDLSDVTEVLMKLFADNAKIYAVVSNTTGKPSPVQSKQNS